MNQHEPIFFTPPHRAADRRRVLHKGGGGSSRDYQAEAEARRAKQAAAFKSGIGYNDEASRTAQYDKLRSDVLGFQEGALSKEYETALRNHQQNIARQGLSGSSADVDGLAELERLYAEQKAAVARNAEGAVTSAKGGWEDSVARSLSLIQQGADAATQITSAMNSYSQKVQEALDAGMGANFGGAFNSLSSAADSAKLRFGAEQQAAGGAKFAEQPVGVAPIGGKKSVGQIF